MKCTASIHKGKGSLRHNDRSIKNISEKNRSWDPELSGNNYVFKNEKIQDVYNELFGGALIKYNEKQVENGRPGRQIKNYFDHISRSKQEHTHYEIVVDVGNTDLIEKGSEREEKARKALDEFCSDFEKRNPNFKVVQMVRHEDESMISHTHIAFIPFCIGGKKGLEVKNSLGGAFTAMGYGRNGFDKWRQNEEQELIKIMKKHDLEFVRADNHLGGLSMREYKEKQIKIVSEAQKELSELKIEKKEVKVNPITKKRSITLLEGEYDDLAKKNALEIAKIEAEKKKLEFDNRLLKDQIMDLMAKPYIELNDELEFENKILKKDKAELEMEKTNLSKKVNDLDMSLKIEKAVNRDLRNEIISIENLIIKLWQLIKVAIKHLTGFDNLVINRIDSESINYCDQLESERIRLKNERSIE